MTLILRSIRVYFMTKVSRYPVERKLISLFINDFWTAVASLKNKKEAQEFFNQLLSPTEKKMFAKRFQIAMMVTLGYRYEEIKRRAKVTDSTVSKIKTLVEEEDSALGSIASRILRLKQIKLDSYSKRSGRDGIVGTLLKAGVGEAIGSVRQIKKNRSLIN